MITGSMARGGKVHLGRKAKMTTDRNGKPYTLYRPVCQKIGFRNLTWLLMSTRQLEDGTTVADETKSQPVTCAKCLAYLAALEAKQQK